MVSRLKGLAVAGLLLALGLGTWALLDREPRGSGLLHYGRIPAFTLIGTDKRPFDGSSLQGKVWIASFVFTTCKNSCPMLSAQMKRLSKGLPSGEGFALLSITVDPDKDTPEALAAYAKAMGAEDPRWHFLTGGKAALKALIQDGFKLAAEPGDEILDERGNPDILHSSKLVLVDKRGDIRGYYDGLLGSSVEAVRRDAQRLAQEP
jgi:protein SCO1/2